MPPEDTSANTPVVSAPVVTTPPTHVVVNKGGDSLFGKVVKWVRKEGEMVLTEVETEFGKFEAWFHESQVKTATPAQIAAATPTPQAPAPAQPAA